MSTFGGALVGALIGRLFSGSTVPYAGGVLACGLLALVFVLVAERGRLFQAHHAPTAGGGADGVPAESFGLH